MRKTILIILILACLALFVIGCQPGGEAGRYRWGDSYPTRFGDMTERVEMPFPSEQPVPLPPTGIPVEAPVEPLLEVWPNAYLEEISWNVVSEDGRVFEYSGFLQNGRLVVNRHNPEMPPPTGYVDKIRWRLTTDDGNTFDYTGSIQNGRFTVTKPFAATVVMPMNGGPVPEKAKNCICEYEAKTMICWPTEGEILLEPFSPMAGEEEEYTIPNAYKIGCTDMRSGLLAPWCAEAKIYFKPPITTKVSTNQKCKSDDDCKTQLIKTLCQILKPMAPNQTPEEQGVAEELDCVTDAAGKPSQCVCAADWEFKQCICE